VQLDLDLRVSQSLFLPFFVRTVGMRYKRAMKTCWVSRLLLVMFVCISISGLVHAIPIPPPVPRSLDSGNEKVTPEKLKIKEVYKVLPLEDVPTQVDTDVLLTNETIIRYGYSFGRPIEPLVEMKFTKAPLLGKLVKEVPALLHWGLLVSNEPPNNSTLTPEGTTVLPPSTGTVFELRPNVTEGLVYLDVKNWETYRHTYHGRPKKVKFHGPLNHTDAELIDIGRAYIREIGQRGFNIYYSNCQIFTSWYVRALWPDTKVPKRADQAMGKFLWWFKDWKNTVNHFYNKIKGVLGFSNNGVPLDSDVAFKDAEGLLRDDGNEEELEKLLHELGRDTLWTPWESLDE